MTFSKSIFKLPSGKNISIYENSASDFDLFIFNNKVRRYSLTKTENSFQCKSDGVDFGYDFVQKIQTKLCVCLNKNVSVIDDE